MLGVRCHVAGVSGQTVAENPCVGVMRTLNCAVYLNNTTETGKTSSLNPETQSCSLLVKVLFCYSQRMLILRLWAAVALQTRHERSLEWVSEKPRALEKKSRGVILAAILHRPS